MPIAGLNSDGTFATQSTNATRHSTTSKKSADSNSALDKEAFLQLLVAQMQNQDPLEPQDNSQMVAQLAAFSQVEELQNMSTTLNQSQASDLLGKTVIMKTESASGETGFIRGVVEYTLNEEGKIYLGINGNEYDINDLDTVINDDFYNNNGM